MKKDLETLLEDYLRGVVACEYDPKCVKNASFALASLAITNVARRFIAEYERRGDKC